MPNALADRATCCPNVVGWTGKLLAELLDLLKRLVHPAGITDINTIDIPICYLPGIGRGRLLIPLAREN